MTAQGAPREPSGRAGDGPSGVRVRRTEYRMQMPVELWFGEHRVGIRRDSATCEAFLRYANELLRELHASRPPNADASPAPDALS